MSNLDCSCTSCRSSDNPIFIAPSWFSAPPGLALPMVTRPDYWRNELLFRACDIERHPGPKRTLPLRGRDVLVQDVLPTTAQRYDVAVVEFENRCELETSMGSKSSSITVSTNLFCVRDPRTGTSRHSHFGLETLRASGEILWC